MKKDVLSIKFMQADETASALPLLTLINPSLSKDDLALYLDEMLAQGYRCALAFYDDLCIAVIGLWVQTKFYVGRHIEYDNFFVLPGYRNQGVGSKMLHFVDEYAKDEGCVAAELHCDILEKQSQAFWERHGFRTIGYCYQKRLVDQ